MGREQLSSKWTRVKGWAEKRWGKWTDGDLAQVHGDYEKITGKIRERYGDSEEHVRSWIDKLEG